ncbi:MAG: response regulator transcription factor [Actinomycetia bacterium]|nr:response regulator transcription factor [Actinomycetes bacterium]MCP4962097.1 response regulator transcription factor [Actinomycetes bacterium]
MVVEDDIAIREAVEGELRASGFAVDAVDDIDDAVFSLDVNDYDCCVFDRTLPGGDAVDLVSQRRSTGDSVPVLFLTARDSVQDRVAGFEAGGDDYLVKPFAMAELVARVTALCRRSRETAPSMVHVADIVIDRSRAEVTRAGVLVPLTTKERAVLDLLASRAGSVVSRTDLIEHCWDENYDPMSNTVDVHIAGLRRKLGKPSPIRTVPKVGYVLEEPGG